MFSDGSPSAMSLPAVETSAVFMNPPIHPTALPMSKAARPIGKLRGNRMPPMKPTMMITRTGRAIHVASHICAAGRIEMNVREIPASMPRRAARGVSLRIVGPTKAPQRMIAPMMNASEGRVRLWTALYTLRCPQCI